MLLDMSSDGSAIRAVVGDCKGPKPAAVEVSTDAGRSWKAVGGEVRQVLRVAARKGGDIWFVGAGADCVPAMHEGADLAASRAIGGKDGTWYLSPGAAGTAVKAPGGPVEAGCTVVSLAAIDARMAYLLCADGTIRVTEDAGAGWRNKSTLAGAVSISFTDAQHGFALAPQQACASAVLATGDGGANWIKRACLRGTRPQAIAAAGEAMLAIVDDAAQRSENAGVSWQPAG